MSERLKRIVHIGSRGYGRLTAERFARAPTDWLAQVRETYQEEQGPLSAGQPAAPQSTGPAAPQTYFGNEAR